MNTTLIRYGATFLAGVFSMWLWHNASISGIRADQAEEKTEKSEQMAQTAVNDAKDAGENSGNYLQELGRKDSEIADLRRQLDAGSIRLRICSAEAATAGIQAHNSRAAADEARADSASSEERAVQLYQRALTVDAWVASCHAWVNR